MSDNSSPIEHRLLALRRLRNAYLTAALFFKKCFSSSPHGYWGRTICPLFQWTERRAYFFNSCSFKRRSTKYERLIDCLANTKETKYRTNYRPACSCGIDGAIDETSLSSKDSVSSCRVVEWFRLHHLLKSPRSSRAFFHACLLFAHVLCISFFSY